MQEQLLHSAAVLLAGGEEAWEQGLVQVAQTKVRGAFLTLNFALDNHNRDAEVCQGIVAGLDWALNLAERCEGGVAWT